MVNKALNNFLKLQQRFLKSGGVIDAREAKVLERAAQRLVAPKPASFDAFESGAKVDAGPLIDRTRSRGLPEPPGGREVHVNRAGDKNVAARAGHKASWHEDVSEAIRRALDRGFHPIPEGAGSLEEGDAYHGAVVEELRKLGYRAFFDGEEVQVKKPGAAHSEAYDISTSSGQVRDFYASWSSPPAFD